MDKKEKIGLFDWFDPVDYVITPIFAFCVVVILMFIDDLSQESVSPSINGGAHPIDNFDKGVFVLAAVVVALVSLRIFRAQLNDRAALRRGTA